MTDLDERVGLRGRHVWVVGAGGGGIGTGVASELAAAGARVVAIDRDRDALEPTLAAVRERGGDCTPRVVDAFDREAMEALGQSESAAGRLPTGLVNVVGGLIRDRWGPVLDTSDETFDGILHTNLRAAWLASQVVAGGLSRAGSEGSIVHLVSISALQGMPYGAAYSAAKAALISLGRTQALEWGPRGIRVNMLAAGTIHVPRSASVDAERDRRAIPLGRRGAPSDIASAALFLLSDLACWITGQVLAVDGGASIKPAYLDDDGLPVFVEDGALRQELRERSERSKDQR